MSRVAAAAVVLAAAVLLSSCAAGPDPLVSAGPGVAGFRSGLWHGIISPVTFIVSLFNDNVSIYEVHNSGGWYDTGFMIGISGVFSGPLSARRAVAPRRSGKEA